LGEEGFAWGGQYRAAGYYANIFLWSSLFCWILMNLLLVAVPRYGAYGMCLTGAILLGASVVYYLMLPKPPLVIVLDGKKLVFHLGWCFWMVFVAGSLCFFIGMIVSAIDLIWPHKFSTILEVYYDTPYDRHVILEESHDVRYRKRNSRGLEEPPSLGSRILRRLSSLTRENSSNDIRGITNRGFQSDVPKSPWRYPFRRNHNTNINIGPNGANMQRTISQDSTSTIGSHHAAMNASTSHPLGGHHVSSLHRAAINRMLPPRPPIDRNKENRELSNW
jgi:dual oxidase maturation factor 1